MQPAQPIAPRPRDLWLPWILLGACNVALGLWFMLGRAPGTDAAWTGLPLDDAWTHLVYARSLGTGAGFAYNPGQPEVGFSSPLWVLLLAPVFWLQRLLGFSLVAGVKVLGMATATFAAVQAFRLAHQITGNKKAAWLAAVIVCADPSLSFARVSGMEVWLTAGLALAAIRALAEDKPRRLGMLLALLPLARPEALAFVAPALLLGIWVLAQKLAAPRTYLALVMPVVLAIGAWSFYCLCVSHRPLPNTFYAKHRGGGFVEQVEDGVTVARMILDLPWFWMGSGLLALAAGIRRVVRGSQSPTQRATCLLLLGGPLLWLAALTWAHDLPQAWPFYWNRYVQPALPGLLVVTAIGALDLIERVVRTWQQARTRVLVPAIVCTLAISGTLATWPARMAASAQRFAWNCQNINEVQVATGQWVATHVEPNEWIVAIDAGAIRFFGQHPVLDVLGLNNHRVLTRGPTSVMAELQPRHFVIFPDLFPGMATAPGMRILHEARSPHYTVSDSPQDRLVVVKRDAPPSAAH